MKPGPVTPRMFDEHDKRLAVLELGSQAMARVLIQLYRKTYKFLSREEQGLFTAMIEDVKLRILGGGDGQ